MNEVYIGQSINIYYRKKSYDKLRCKRQFKLYNSLVKYGPENHKFNIIKECSWDVLDKLEKHYKTEFIEEQGWEKALFYYINDTNIGGPQSNETRIKKKNIAIEKGFGKWNKGKNHKEIGTYLKIYSPLIKPILQYDLKGNFIKEWISVNEASRIFKGVPNALTGRSKTSCGCIWKYKEN
jgi:hypothetical protein